MAAWLRRFMFLVLPIGGVIAGIVAVVATLAANQPEPDRTAEEARGLAVFVTPAREEATRLRVASQGEVRPRTQIDMVSQVAGRLDYVAPNFVDGGFFEEGEVLLRVEDADFRLAVTRADAMVAQARRALESERAQAELARRDWEEIGEGDPTSLALRQPQLAEARAALAGAQASLEEAQLHLSRTEIRAPFTGRVREKAADLGQYVAPGQRLGQLFATDRVEIRLPLSDAQLAHLNLPIAFSSRAGEPGPEAVLSAIVAGQRREWRGEVVRTDSAIDARTRTLNAIVEVQDPYGAGADETMPLAVGLFVNAAIEGRIIENAIIAPRAALRGDDRVYVANEDGTLTVRTVSVIASEPDRVVLANGVSPGEYVITSAVRAASEGMRVEAYAEGGELLFGGPEADEEEDDAEAADDAETADDADDAEDRADAEVASTDDEDGGRT